MKAKEFEKDAKNIIAEDKRKYVTERLANRLREIDSIKAEIGMKTEELKRLESDYKDLLSIDVEDILIHEKKIDSSTTLKSYLSRKRSVVTSSGAFGYMEE